MAPRIIERTSPNHDERPEAAAIDMLVLHYTGMKTAEEALARLCDPESRVSAHYTIDRDGTIYAHVPEERRAWHAGVSFWAGERNINGCSIGIELVNPGHEFGYEEFAEAQIAALIDLSSEIAARHAIAPARVLGHSDVAPARKEDPGELFPWAHLAEYGVGIWPFPALSVAMCASPPSGPSDHLPRGRGRRATESSSSPACGGGVARSATEGGFDVASDIEQAFLRNLRDYGYGLGPDVDVPLAKVVAAFQRHWRPWKIDGVIDEESAYRLDVLVNALS